MTRVCICGGGSLGHVCAGVLSSQTDVKVNILTQHPENWTHHITVKDLHGKIYSGTLSTISDNAQEAVSNCDIVFLCLPGFAIENTLETLKPYIGNKIIGSIVCSTGFFFAAHKILGANARLFGFQRVPFIARTKVYGSSADLLGYKPQLAIATENINDKDAFRQLAEKLWITPTRLLASHYEVSLTNSNPILHTGRLYSMWKDWKGETYDHNILFYKEWTNDASQILIDMDAEFMKLLEVLPITPGAIPSLLEYYESIDAESLTRKISSIIAFQNITSPMIQSGKGWIPDFKSRYFTEDFPYGLAIIKRLADERRIKTPVIDKVYEWGMSKCNK